MDAVLPFRAMAYNNAWANHRLLNACALLSQADLVAPRTGYFPSLRATLNHILIVDHFYVDAMEGGTPGPAAWADREPCETVAQLQTTQSEVDHRLIAIVERLTAPDLNTIVEVRRGDRIQRERFDRLLLHLFQHQIHHRGQAHAMLSATETAPPQLDEFFSVVEAPLRAAEFAALGWSEDTVWGAEHGSRPRPTLMAVEPQLFVTDITASCDFYVQKLGFQFAFRYGEPPYYAILRPGLSRRSETEPAPGRQSGLRRSVQGQRTRRFVGDHNSR